MTPDNAIWWLRLKAKQKQTQKYEGPIYQGGTLPTTDITAKKPSREVMGKNVRMGIHKGSIDERSLNPEQKEALQLYDFKQKVASRPIGKEIIEAHLSPLSIGANLSGYVANKWKGDGKARFDEINSDRSRQVSKELGIENPVGAFLTDVLTDPTTFLGATSVAKLLMNPKRIGDVAKIIVTGSKQLPKKGMGLIDDAIKLSNNLKSKVDDVVRPISAPVQKSAKNISSSFVEKAIEPKFLHKLMRDNPSVKYKKEYIGSLKNKEINELNKNRIVELNEHWMYKNAEDIQLNKELNAQIEPLSDEFINFKNRYFKFNKKEYVNNLDNKIKEIKNNFQGLDPTNPYVIKQKNIIKNDPDYINNLIKERDLVLKEIDDYGNNLYRDSRMSQKDYDAMSSEERHAHHLKIDDNYENLLNKLLELYNKEKNIELNPHFINKIKNMYKEADKPIPFDNDIYRGEGLQDKTHVLYPYLDESNFDKIPSDLHDKIYENMLTSDGWSSRQASVSYGIDFLGNKPVGVFGTTLIKKPFNIRDVSTWGRGKMVPVQNKIPDEIIDNHYFTNKKPEDIMTTVGHEGTHDLQRQAGMHEIIDKWDDGVKYYTTHGENKVSKMFKENLVSSTDDAWRGSGNELWADFGAERLMIMDKLHSDPKIASEMFRANESYYIDMILESGKLNGFFKPGVSKETKKKMLEILGAINIVGVTGTTLDASDK